MASALFAPLEMRGLTLGNRVAISPLCQFVAVNGNAQPWHAMHIGHLAISGAGFFVLEATAVEDIGRITPGCLGLYSDENEAALTRILRDVRTYSNMPIGIQLSHAGRKASTRPTWELWKGHIVPKDEGGWDLVGPSAEPFNDGWPMPEALDAEGLAHVRECFVRATQRAERCGFDLVEVHVAHGYLLHQFLSPLANHRTDAYGGTPEKRMRYPLEVIEAMRRAWPADKPLGVRITARDFNDGGLDLDDAVAFSRALREIGVDYVTPSAGNVAPGMKLPKVEPGYMVPFAEKVKREAGITTMAVGLIVTPRQAEEIVASGRADLVAIGRGFMDNPRWVWHAAAELGGEVAIPPPYNRIAPKAWAAYGIVHDGDARVAEGMAHASRE